MSTAGVKELKHRLTHVTKPSRRVRKVKLAGRPLSKAILDDRR